MKLSIAFAHSLVIGFPGIYPVDLKMRTCTKTCGEMFIAPLSMISKKLEAAMMSFYRQKDKQIVVYWHSEMLLSSKKGIRSTPHEGVNVL